MATSLPWSRSSRLARLACAVVGLTSIAMTAACAAEPGEEVDEDGELAFTGTPNEDIGQLFMIEHFGVEAGGYADVHSMLAKKNLGALILWNPTQASGETARAMARRYAATAESSGHPELFIAADHEESATQRFKSRHGFTDLAPAATLGRVIAREGNAHVCELHARITSRELASAGLNMALGTVSDLYTRDSGTPGMFRNRAIGSDAQVVSSCIRAMTDAYAAEGHLVFVTKHFPGLGNASGNTDVDPKVRSYSTTKDEMDSELAPYRAATASVNQAGSASLFGAMISHASYEILDRSKQPATLSPLILDELLRSNATKSVSNGVDEHQQPATFAGMDFAGLTVSDAFWTWGAAKDLSPVERRRLMARSFLAGMDILMIAKADFNGAWDYFQSIYASTLPPAEQAALVREANATSFAALVTAFRERVTASAQRIRAAKAKVGKTASNVGHGDPRAASTEAATEYKRLVR